MSAHSVAPGAQAKRFAAYLDRLALAAEHADRATPLKSYCTGLLLPGERKSVEPMAARLYPNNVRQAHQSMHHIVADAAWSDEDMLEAVRAYVLPQLEQKGPIVASRGGQFVGEHRACQPAHRLASVLAGGVGEGRETEKEDRGTRGDSISDQAGDCTGTNPRGAAARDSGRGRADRRRLRNRYPVSRRDHGFRVAL